MYNVLYLSWNEVLACDSMLLSVEHSILLCHIIVWFQLHVCSRCLDSMETLVHCTQQEEGGSTEDGGQEEGTRREREGGTG